MCIPYHLIQDTIKRECNLDTIIHDNNVYAEIYKGMYGLPQVGKIANDQLIKHLAYTNPLYHKKMPIEYTKTYGFLPALTH